MLSWCSWSFPSLRVWRLGCLGFWGCQGICTLSYSLICLDLHRGSLWIADLTPQSSSTLYRAPCDQMKDKSSLVLSSLCLWIKEVQIFRSNRIPCWKEFWGQSVRPSVETETCNQGIKTSLWCRLLTLKLSLRTLSLKENALRSLHSRVCRLCLVLVCLFEISRNWILSFTRPWFLFNSCSYHESSTHLELSS